MNAVNTSTADRLTAEVITKKSDRPIQKSNEDRKPIHG